MGTRPPSDLTGPVLGWGASELGRSRRSGRRPDDQISLGNIQSGIEKTGGDSNLPRIACRSAAMEDQRSLAHDPHSITTAETLLDERFGLLSAIRQVLPSTSDGKKNLTAYVLTMSRVQLLL
jgi:hypothetical protein